MFRPAAGDGHKMASHLSSGRINLSVVRESYRREFLELLDKCHGTKVAIYLKRKSDACVLEVAKTKLPASPQH